MSRETKANRNAGRSRTERRVSVYTMHPLDPAEPVVPNRWLAWDARWSRPEVVKEVEPDSFACTCGVWWRSEPRVDCPHILAVRHALGNGGDGG